MTQIQQAEVLKSLKARAYDLIHQIELGQQELREINDRIAKITNGVPAAGHHKGAAVKNPLQSS